MNRTYPTELGSLTIGRRPPEEGGHRGVKLSLNKKCRDFLAELKSRGESMSKFVEDAILAEVHRQVNTLHRGTQSEPSYADPADQRISVQVNYKLELHECMSIAESATLP